MSTIIYYHAPCTDGFTAAWVAYKALGMADVSYRPLSHNQFAELSNKHTGQKHSGAGITVYFLDIAPPWKLALEMARAGYLVHIIDHHKSAMENYTFAKATHHNLQVLFDTSHSGAGLAWRHFFGETPPPELVRYVEDRDLWRFSLPDSHAYNGLIFSNSYTFTNWDAMNATPAVDMIREGKAIQRKHHKDVTELLRACARYEIVAGYRVPVANLPYTYASDAGNMMAKGETPDGKVPPFAACYFVDKDGRMSFSLRSTDAGDDVSVIAKLFGGGGHRNAAGFSTGVWPEKVPTLPDAD